MHLVAESTRDLNGFLRLFARDGIVVSGIAGSDRIFCQAILFFWSQRGAYSCGYERQQCADLMCAREINTV